MRNKKAATELPASAIVLLIIAAAVLFFGFNIVEDSASNTRDTLDDFTSFTDLDDPDKDDKPSRFDKNPCMYGEKIVIDEEKNEHYYYSELRDSDCKHSTYELKKVKDGESGVEVCIITPASCNQMIEDKRGQEES